MPFLPESPKVELDVVADHSAETTGFLALERLELVLRNGDARSASFRYDMVHRRALHAAVMAAHHVSNGKVCVYLRSAIRPPVALQASEPRSAVLWELPAGLIEPGEAPAAAAARELEEELGFSVTPDRLLPLGPWMYPAPGFVGEQHWLFHVRVDDVPRNEPGGDGSPLEAAALIASVPLEDALAACHSGEIRDSKTELALRRLADVLR